VREDGGVTAASPLAIRHLFLATFSFGLCFAGWGLVSGLSAMLREGFALGGTEIALLVAAPVILGSVLRVPAGLLADRFGARILFPILCALLAVAALLLPEAPSYPLLLADAFLLGVGGASFSVGVSYLSPWVAPERQGTALGIYGMGNVGQSVVVFLGPVLANAVGMRTTCHIAAAVLAVWAVFFALLARDRPRTPDLRSLATRFGGIVREGRVWRLALFYFLTFGAFVAFAVYLPTLLVDEFRLTPADAGLRAAGFVVLATAMRPVGGWLADRIGGARVLQVVFLGIVPFALLLAWPSMLPFTVGALGASALLGAGNGAVFRLVAQHYPRDAGTVSGLVGAVGGLGGFFPPLLLGVLRDEVGVVWPGYCLLAAVALFCAWLNKRAFLPPDEALEDALPAEWRRAADRLRAGVWATLWTGLLAAAIVVGSRNLQNFDPALVVYTFAVLFATFGVTYHYCVWIQKPPTQVYWRRGWRLAFGRGWLRRLAALPVLIFTQIAEQGFIRRRSFSRWVMHQLLFWGCLLAVAITFPLVFGWIHFTSAPDDQMVYVTHLFGFEVASFRVGTVTSFLILHGLDFAAFLVLGGVAMALWRRMRDRGAQTVQDFWRDLLPLVLLFAISLTGLALTASSLWLRGSFYGFLSILHAVTVVAALLYLPFGKFFHIFQRPAQLGVKLYQKAGEAGEGAHCARCGERFTSRMHLEDLDRVLVRLGFDYRIQGPAGSWQHLCPACKRKSLAAAQLRLRETDRG
jgi:nitrate/nitrite transporter NarK